MYKGWHKVWGVVARNQYLSVELGNLFSQSILKYDLRDLFLFEQPKFQTFTWGFRSFRYIGFKLRYILSHSVKNKKDMDVLIKTPQSGVTAHNVFISLDVL